MSKAAGNWKRNRHNHEFLGSTRLAGTTLHNHRFAGVSGRAIFVGNTHVHVIKTNTDFTARHFHKIKDISGPEIPVGLGRHVHFVRGRTSFDLGHRHGYLFATLIENPLLL
ncbi:MAG TPA: YmaF family protein [Bacillota bacterium]|nr:YmaF family protein [Bacillota bacterium]